MKKLFAPLLWLVAALLLGGCASNTQIVVAGLRADLVRVQRSSAGEVQVTWRVRNPNVVPYVLTRASLKISFNGQSLGVVNDQTRLGVPINNAIEHTAVLTQPSAEAGQLVTQALAQGSASYALDANFWVLLVDDKEEKFQLKAAGTVPVTAQ
jgi:hypothetical protein